MRKTAVALFLILFVSTFLLFAPLSTVKASTTLTFSASTGYGTIYVTDSYSTAQTASSGTIQNSYIIVGQSKSADPPSTIRRGYVHFDTSSLPNDATIDSAILSLYVSGDDSLTDFNVTIQNGTSSTYPHNPLLAGDYYYQNYANDGGSANTSTISGAGWWNITLNSDGYNMISLTSDTKLCLRSSNDIAASEPSGDEYVTFYNSNPDPSYTAKLYVEYSLPPSYSTITFSSNPEVNADFTINGTDYTTPSYVSWADGDVVHVTAEEALIYSGTGYLFDHYLVNDTTTYTDRTKDITVTGDTTIEVYYVEIPDLYHFYGPYDEETGLLLDENVTVTVYYDTDDYEPYSFEFNTSWVYPTSPQAQYFRFNFTDGTYREYWVDSSEVVLPIYIFHGNKTGNILTYTINFLDTTGILRTYPYVTIKRYVNGTLYTVEKRKADVYGSILANLIYARTYQITLGNEENSYTFGDLTTTATTSVQLVLRTVDFPQQTLLTQKNVHCYCLRNGSIYVVYEDELETTTSVNVTIYYSDFTQAYTTTSTSQSFTVEWSSADNSTAYQVTVTVTHATYGTLTFKTYLPADTALSTAPFSLDFLGDWTFDSSVIIPSILILFVAGCFSAANAYVGAILMVIAAIILTIIGWIPISAGILVAAFAFAVIMALVYHKRGVG